MERTTIKFPVIQEIAMKGVRRTAVFMGLGTSAAADPNLKRYELSDSSPLRFLPSNLDDKTLSHFKEEFSRWIVACGLRELIETYSVFLDEVHYACLHIENSLKLGPKASLSGRNNKFRHLGLDRKLKELRTAFNVETPAEKHLSSINQVRNCLTHRRGIVGEEDCNGTQELVVKWRGLDIYAETPSGKVISLLNIPDGGVLFPQGGEVKAKLSERTKSFPLKSVVRFAPSELAEICHLFVDCTKEVIGSAEAYAKSHGIPDARQSP